MRTIVISAVNLTKGGTLTILRECLRYLSELSETGNYRIVALVHRKELANFRNIEYIEMQWPKKNWANRLWCEYVTMKKISVKLSPVYLWLSLHDTTPNVLAEKRAVYYHNSLPFYKWKMKEWLFTPRIVLLALFSKYIYRKNIHENTYLVVQQEWMKRALIHLFRLREETMIVAPPSSTDKKTDDFPMNNLSEEGNYSFLFASYPDSHKNFEVICQAAEILKEQLGIEDFKVYLTIKEEDNAYAQWLFRKWGKIPNIEFIGFLDRKSLYEYYNQCNCLIFPSKVETWGLPITEFAAFHKPMLLADLPYTHETASECNQVAFFNPDDPHALADKMKRLIQGDDRFLVTAEKVIISLPVARSWQELFNILLA
ncbi:MAG: glycosyltransferase family 4 protein [Dysgonamonadaceae bacterium]|jgi:glycosyltransferase involved in cell wall biosynthesis|nr:glycosyltransferase family 4 protein [Dysgonamonadaceae bacterium]